MTNRITTNPSAVPSQKVRYRPFSAVGGRVPGEARDAVPDRPIYELVEDFPDVDSTKTDMFRDWVQYSTAAKAKLAEARDAQSTAAIREIDKDLEPIEDQEAAGVVVDPFLSYRAVKAWKEMAALVDKISSPLAPTVMVQEQLAFALTGISRESGPRECCLTFAASPRRTKAPATK